MGKKLKKEAAKLGITSQPKYTFYARPRKLKMKFSKYKPDIAYKIENFMMSIDPSTMSTESGGGRNNTFYFLSTQMNMYAEIADRMAGMIVPNPINHAIQIDIYTNNQDYIKSIVRDINNIWDDGILAHLDIHKLAKKYKVREEDIINAWKSFL